MIYGKWCLGLDQAKDALDLRYRVFVEEQGFPADVERDGTDASAWHLQLYLEERCVAALRIFREDEETWHLGRLAVEKGYRGQGLGEFALRTACYKALQMGAKRMRVNAQQQVQDFYARFGFRPEGEPFMEQDCPHVAMETPLPLPSSCHCGRE